MTFEGGMRFLAPVPIAQAIKPSDIQQHNNPTERSVLATVATKLKETTIVVGGWIRTSFDMKCSAGTGKGQVYKNGVALGTLQSSTSTVYITYVENLLFAVGDLFQIYAYNNTSGQRTYIRNQKVLGTIVIDYEDTAGF